MSGRPVGDIEDESVRIIGATVADAITQAVGPALGPYQDALRKNARDLQKWAGVLDGHAADLAEQTTTVGRRLAALTEESGGLRGSLDGVVGTLADSQRELTAAVTDFRARADELTNEHRAALTGATAALVDLAAQLQTTLAEVRAGQAELRAAQVEAAARADRLQARQDTTAAGQARTARLTTVVQLMSTVAALVAAGVAFWLAQA